MAYEIQTSTASEFSQEPANKRKINERDENENVIGSKAWAKKHKE